MSQNRSASAEVTLDQFIFGGDTEEQEGEHGGVYGSQVALMTKRRGE
jgi:hypothetical protein